MVQTDVVIAGAGVIGMALAVELRRRGRRVIVLERGVPGAGASSAAAGMLAALDPAHPVALRPLAVLSEQMYPAFLDDLAHLAPRERVVIQTGWTLEATTQVGPEHPLPHGVVTGAGPFCLLRETSLDPRQLVAALVAACKQSGVRLLQATPLRSVEAAPKNTLRVETGVGSISCAQFVDCTGAWSSRGMRPVKGQMLRVQLGEATPHLQGYGNIVVRTPSIYVVPRMDGSAVIGATVEEKGFCVKTKDSTIADLRARAASLVRGVADAPEVERWAGLRPASVDGLPSLGLVSANMFVAAGHFRNGVLLAPATARLMAQVMCGESPSLALNAFSPARFGDLVR